MSPRSMWSKGEENRTTIRVSLNQMIKEDTTAFQLDFQTRNLRQKSMTKYVFAIKAIIDARFSIINSRLKKLKMIARPCPVNQPASNMEEIMQIRVLITAFSMSTTAIFVTRMFGTVRKDLNRAITARISPLPNLTPRASETVNS